MRLRIVFPIIVALLFCSVVRAQDSVVDSYLHAARTAVAVGDCHTALKKYKFWQACTAQNDYEVESLINECQTEAEMKNRPFEEVPGTHLQITKKPVAKRVTFLQAMELCSELRYGGHDDWRLPTTNELFSIFAAGKNHGRTFAGMSFDASNRIIRGNTTVKEYDVMRPDGTTSHRSTDSNDNLPFDCFCVRNTLAE